MLKRIFLFLFCFTFADTGWHKDKIMIYIDNSTENLIINKSQTKTNKEDLNKLLVNESVKSISPWLSNARPSDRDGDIFLNRFYVVSFYDSSKSINERIKLFNQKLYIKSVEPVAIIKNHLRPNDMFYELQYAIPQINATNAYNLWDIENGEIPGHIQNDTIVVAVNDYPVMWYHPDLIDNIWQNLAEDADGDGTVFEYTGTEWILDPGDINNLDDDNDGFIDNLIGWNAHSNEGDIGVNLSLSHGTDVAGCVSSMTNNETGIASVGWSIKIMGITNCEPGGSITSGYEGILTAAQMGADIINNSWGSSGGPDYAQALINTVLNEYTSLIVASSGNAGTNIANYPAAFEGVVSVTSTSEGSVFSCWATRHETVDIAAPGDNVFTTTTSPNEGGFYYNYATGTSFSAPIISGALGLLKSIYPDGDNTFLISKIKDNANYYNDMDGNCNGENLNGLVGTGELNIREAIINPTPISLAVSNINVLSTTGNIIPGDTTEVILTILNASGSTPLKELSMSISTEHERISIVNGYFNTNQVLPSGGFVEASFLITSTHDMSYGDINFDLNIDAQRSGNFPSNYSGHEDSLFLQIEIFLPFGSLQQYGYPISNVEIKHPPLVVDLDNNSIQEIYFSSDSTLYGKMIGGLDVPGFPYYSSSKITTPCASGDLDNDSFREVIFGTEDGYIFSLKRNGSQLFNYEQEDLIVGHPLLSDIDNDGYLDVVFISTNDSSSRVHCVDYTGNDIENFPVYIQNPTYKAPAIGDINNDGLNSIIFYDKENTLYITDYLGQANSVVFDHDFSKLNNSPTITNLNEDPYLEIILSDSSGNIYVIDYQGTLLNQISIENTIQNNIVVSDLDQDGSTELVFYDNNNKLYAFNYNSSSFFEGWPISLNESLVSEPIIVNLNNDNDLEILLNTTDGFMYVMHHDGLFYQNFPFISQDSLFSVPSIADIDNDNDAELIFGTNTSLNVIDVNFLVSNQQSWNVYRGNIRRDGFFNFQPSNLSLENKSIPAFYYLNHNFPNPFNPTTRITYSLPKKTLVSIIIYDLLGKKVNTLIDKELQEPGTKTVQWHGKNQEGLSLSSGVYFYSLETKDFLQKKKMILIK